MIRKEIIKISGMSCAACAGRIEKSLQGLAGVRQAVVNLALEEAAVEYDSSQVEVSGLIKAVEALGFRAERAEEDHRDREEEVRARERRRRSEERRVGKEGRAGWSGKH